LSCFYFGDVPLALLSTDTACCHVAIFRILAFSDGLLPIPCHNPIFKRAADVDDRLPMILGMGFHASCLLHFDVLIPCQFLQPILFQI
jgi:hypothetical protein